MRKRGKEKQYHLPYYIEAFWKNIKSGKREGDGNFKERKKQDFKKWGWEEYQVVGNFIHPCDKVPFFAGLKQLLEFVKGRGPEPRQSEVVFPNLAPNRKQSNKKGI